MAGGDGPKVEARHIAKRFGKHKVINDVSFEVQEGEVLGLLGPSGSGKTTILRGISGLEDIDEGEILVDGQIMSSPKKGINVPPERRRLGFVFQSYALWPHMSVRQNLAYTLHGMSPEDKSKRIKESLDLVGLGSSQEKYPAQLSGGMQQRVALARSLCYQPSLILLDEPMSNLDLRERERVRGELRRLLKKIGITSIFVTHDQEEAFVVSDRVVLLNKGVIVQEGSPNELYSRPLDLFTAQFIGRTNVLKAEVVEVIEKERRARLRFPELAAELICEYESMPDRPSLAAIRFNEISLSSRPIEKPENVLEGTLVSREYRGSVTDHIVRVGEAELVITTHKFCSTSEHSPTGGKKFIYIPPGAIKPIRE